MKFLDSEPPQILHSKITVIKRKKVQGTVVSIYSSDQMPVVQEGACTYVDIHSSIWTEGKFNMTVVLK